jgi:hypothetical protein
MARTIALTRYPLLKFLVPLAVVVAILGVFLFFTQNPTGPACGAAGQEACPKDPMVLLPWLLVAAVLAFASLLWKRKEEVTVVLPSDRLQDASRQDLQGILETLERQREKGELTPERYTKARNKVLKQMQGGAKSR